MANIFNITWSNVVENLIPWFWRETTNGNEAKILPYLRSIINPVQTISDNLLSLEETTIDFLNYNGQHKILEEYLNDLYDITLRRIYITENNIGSIDKLAIGLTSDTITSPITIGLSSEIVSIPLVIGLSGEILAGFNFTINIPVSITYNTIVLTAQIKNYSEASKTFNFTIF